MSLPPLPRPASRPASAASTGTTFTTCAPVSPSRLSLHQSTELEGGLRSLTESLLDKHDEELEAAPRGLERLSDYCRRFLLMAAWLLALAAGYGVERVACQLKLPYDCIRRADLYEFYSDFSNMALYGTVLGWFVGITDLDRFRWLSSRRRWYVWAVFLGTPPAYSAISNIPGLRHDLAHWARWGPAFIAVESVALAGILGVVLWHLIAAKRGRGWADFFAYLLSRLVVLAWFGGSALMLKVTQTATVYMHLHHLYIGWMLALWAEFSSPLSGVTLAVGTGIFVQGVSAYSFAPIFIPGGCFDTPAGLQLDCSFRDDSPFTLR
ncbi:hypothetical protein N2152v2_000854 [Parachlorella kessleri]